VQRKGRYQTNPKERRRRRRKKKKSGKNVAHLSESEEDGVDQKERKSGTFSSLLRGGTLMVGNTGRLPGSFIVQPGCIIPQLTRIKGSLLLVGTPPPPSPHEMSCVVFTFIFHFVCRSKLNL
jgi:hypothetical protein